MGTGTEGCTARLVVVTSKSAWDCESAGEVGLHYLLQIHLFLIVEILLRFHWNLIRFHSHIISLANEWLEKYPFIISPSLREMLLICFTLKLLMFRTSLRKECEGWDLTSLWNPRKRVQVAPLIMTIVATCQWRTTCYLPTYITQLDSCGTGTDILVHFMTR